ncbi:MAG: dynamin family protein, partial [Verrucomicrobia bacterium]|nr:dynamin family protein [Verrucomicrobiota bacterium]
MKTEIAGFCKEYDFALSPLVNDLKTASDCIERESRGEVLRGTLAGLLDVGMRLKSLADKIEGQQAYLLIFGPLKSGKSTLMNAISGTYVSEVTSLPAYPCLVYVRHGEKAFTVTNYDGKEKCYPDNPSLQEAIAVGHASLADRIREKEHQGAGFDPGVDFPEAIRRIDIRLPISGLVESSTVMVDTPGLYSRMKFGYDLMTREFRDSAACAVFVVKTDNLYLEQVFAEFKDLLELFSRIFLVVNIDCGKRDLRPDGTLQPSLESRHPGKI